MSDVDVSIIICTRNHADSLRQTLRSLAHVDVPCDLSAELIVVDNDSTDATAEVVRTLAPAAMRSRCVLERRPGLGNARNAGLSSTRGRVILFTDDDVRLPSGWIEQMCNPILSGDADAVAGMVRLANHLRRPWMTVWHTAWLADTDCIRNDPFPRMVGANMAFARSVLDKVPRFDEELGAGTLQCGEETLFSMQLVEAGFRIVRALEVEVEHHCDDTRLTRRSYIHTGQRMGRGDAYIAHHWQHEAIPRPRLAHFRAVARLAYYHATRGTDHFRAPIPTWELQLRRDVSYYRHYLLESRRRRNYARRGLTKLSN